MCRHIWPIAAAKWPIESEDERGRDLQTVLVHFIALAACHLFSLSLDRLSSSSAVGHCLARSLARMMTKMVVLVAPAADHLARKPATSATCSLQDHNHLLSRRKAVETLREPARGLGAESTFLPRSASIRANGSGGATNLAHLTTPVPREVSQRRSELANWNWSQPPSRLASAPQIHSASLGEPKLEPSARFKGLNKWRQLAYLYNASLWPPLEASFLSPNNKWLALQRRPIYVTTGRTCLTRRWLSASCSISSLLRLPASLSPCLPPPISAAPTLPASPIQLARLITNRLDTSTGGRADRRAAFWCGLGRP